MSSSDITTLVSKARALLQSSQSEKALELLTPSFETYNDQIEYLQIFGETLLENNDLENAYDVLVKACELDPIASKGVEKFFYFGQIIGGQDGINSLNIGLQKLQQQLDIIQHDKDTEDELLVELSKLYPTKESLLTYLIKKLNQGIFAKIEIWMTDLCMEDEAETQCNDLINYSISLDPNNPEALSLLSSIRISQQRNEEAKEALLKSWQLFQQKKVKLEESANKIKQGAEEEEGEDLDSFEVGLEYVDLIQPLSTLAKFAIELELYEITITIVSNIQDINENILDIYYYEAIANLFHAKQILFQSSSTKKASEDDDYRDIDVSILLKSSNPEIKSLMKEVKSSLTQGFKIINSDNLVADLDPGLIEQVELLLKQVGGPDMSELIPSRKGEDEDGWEDEINSEDEEDDDEEEEDN
ncbi:hypothetical protein DFJ63DRAFT_56978 [Scheffersomyces coipomensis]|uniref:uncharacterized protein n=1 Tax=Scheffersomyces coipomensis TaxID=1788519 RepID=UPI00315CF6FF